MIKKHSVGAFKVMENSEKNVHGKKSFRRIAGCWSVT